MYSIMKLFTVDNNSCILAKDTHLAQRWWKHFSFGQAKYCGGIIYISMLDWKMDWNGGMDYGIEKNTFS